ncbi:unnamed protein product [Ixodes hexagonus]
MVQVTVGTKTSQKTRNSQAWSLWKMNERLLENEDFKKGVESALENIECTKHGWGQKWEMFKQEIRKMAIELSSIVAYGKKYKKGGLMMTFSTCIALNARNQENTKMISRT